MDLPDVKWGELSDDGIEEVEPSPLVVAVVVVVGVAVRSSCEDEVEAGEFRRFSSDLV